MKSKTINVLKVLNQYNDLFNDFTKYTKKRNVNGKLLCNDSYCFTIFIEYLYAEYQMILIKINKSLKLYQYDAAKTIINEIINFRNEPEDENYIEHYCNVTHSICKYINDINDEIFHSSF
jgi:hypothetical protein